MGKITLSGAIPGDNNDGIGPHAKDLIDHPLTLVNVVCRVAVSKIVTNTETGVTYPVIKIHHWEVVGDEHMQKFGEIIGAAYGGRTGVLELPFPAGEVPMKDEADPFPEEDEESELAEHQARGRS
jgi:hypothetical protein